MNSDSVSRNEPLFTIGHSNHAMDAFLLLLRLHRIQVLVDVRSRPHSRFVPHFSKRRLETTLVDAGIRYLFLGKELGGRPDAAEFHDAEGKVDYARLAASSLFCTGVERVVEGVRLGFRIALMCAEKDPARCHRGLLLAPALRHRNIRVIHILGDGSLKEDTDS